MARPNRTGLDYYQFDTDIFLDRKIRRLIKRYKSDGFMIYTFVLTEIYRDEGCFLKWDNDTAFDISDQINVPENLVIEVVKFCCDVNLFDSKLFIKENVLTSKSIQERWSKISKDAKRSVHNVNKINKHYDLITEETELPQEETELFQEETPKTIEENTQRIVKNSIVKDSKEDDIKEKEISDFKNKIIDIDKLPFDYLLNKRVINAVLDNKKNKFRNLQHLEKQLFVFVAEQKGNGVLSKTMEDFSSHFRYWNIKQFEKEQSADEVKVRTSNIPIG